jgi:hypothetical protein
MIDNLKNKISELQLIIKQKENNNNNNNNLGNNFNSNTFKYTKKKISSNKNNLAELDIDYINTNQIIDGYLGNIKNNSIRSMTNINNIFCNTIEDKAKNKNNKNNNNNDDIVNKDKDEKEANEDKDKDFEKLNSNSNLKRNNSTNKNYAVISKKIEVKNGNKNISNNSLTLSNIGNYMHENKSMKININNNDSVDRNSISKKFLEKNHKNLIGNKDDIINERVEFSPQASRTSVGFGLKKLSIKLNNTPKENVKVSKKIFENKNTTNKKNTYSKTNINNNLSGSLNNNINNDLNRNSYTNNNQPNLNNKRQKKENQNQINKKNINNDLYNNNKIKKK